MPRTLARTSSSDERSMTGMSLEAAEDFSSRSNSTPSMSGSSTSRITTSTACLEAKSLAEAPVAQSQVSKPASSSASFRSMRTVMLSSTIRTRGFMRLPPWPA